MAGKFIDFQTYKSVCSHTVTCALSSMCLHHGLNIKMGDMMGPQKWSQITLIAPWWLTEEWVIKQGKKKYTLNKIFLKIVSVSLGGSFPT